MGLFGKIFGGDKPLKEKKPKKKKHFFDCEVKGHFVHERQRALSRAFRDHYDKDNEPREDETTIFDALELVAESDNEYDPNAIAIVMRAYGLVGYVPKEKTEELRANINLDEPYRTAITIYRDPKEYFADITVSQKNTL